MASDEERFSEKDIRKIIHRALEIQSRGAGSRIPASGGAGGYTLGDLEAVARDLGIQPALIRQAAVDISASQLSKAGRWFLGAGRLKDTVFSDVYGI